MTSKRSQVIEPFLAVEIFERAQELERQGKDIIHLEFGEPDFDTPPIVREAAEKALKDGRTRYAHSLGLLPLREAIAEHYHTRYGVTVSPEQILVTAGTSPAMLLLFSTLLDPGDEVLLTDPRYAVYPNLIRYPGGECVHAPTWETDGFQCRPDEFGRRLTPRSKAVLINSPANPTGAVMTAASLRDTARLGPWIISDEIYHGLTYEGAEHSILEFTDHAFVLNGFSKAYAMTGWRLGYLIAPRDFVRALQVAHGNFFISTNEFVQWAALAALTEAGDDALRFRKIFDQRRSAMVTGLRRIGLGVEVAPTGAFYVLANAQRFGADSKALAFDILEHAHVGVTPGVDFGSRAEGYLRFSYANSLERIEEAMERIGRYLSPEGGMTGAECVMCTRVAGEGPLFVADLPTSRVYFNQDQFFPGWVFVVLRRHAIELYELTASERAAHIEDVNRVASALARVYEPVKMNYELLGNQVPHIHWHLVPRLAGDPEPRWPVWRVSHEPKTLPDAEVARRIGQIRAALG